MYPSGSGFKRPASAISNDGTAGTGGSGRKKSRKEDEDGINMTTSPTADKEEVKAKPTRGSRACTVCRRLKMKCVGAESGGPCKRCLSGNHECIFEESNRGKRSSKKHELLTRSLRKMERTLDTVLRSIGNPGIASGMVSRSPSPMGVTAGTQALIATAEDESGDMEDASGAGAGPYSQNHLQPHARPQPGASPKLHSLPDNALNPLGLLAEASLANRKVHNPNASPLMARGAVSDGANSKGPQMGVASDNYFKPGPMTILPLRRLYIERQVQPEMLTFVKKEEVVGLFDIFFDHIAMHCNLLDRNFHTPSLVCSRSPFLLTTICSIASKYYLPNPSLHPRLTELAKKLAFSVPAQGYKSLEIVQAYLLLSLWGCGAVERYEQDKTWLLLGMGIRMATDLNLHRKTTVASLDTQEGRARDLEVHNRERTWILCFSLDRSFSAQMGKPGSIKEDAIIRNASKWCHAPIAAPSDASLCAYSELQRVMSRCLDFLYAGTDTPSGLQVHCDYMLVIKSFEAQLLTWKDRWIISREFKGDSSDAIEYKKLIANFYYNYSMLVINSFGLQNALERAPVDLGHFFAQCHSSATACALFVRDELGPRGYMKYAPDSHCVMISYAVLSLLKLIRPEFHPYLDDEQRTLSLVSDVADTLESCAANSLHTPALYSHFLRALITAKSSSATNTGESSSISGDAATTNSTNDDPNQQQQQQQHQQQQQQSQPYTSTEDPNVNGVTFNPGAAYAGEPGYSFNPYQFESEMGPVVDMSVFPPTMAPNPPEGDMVPALTMDNILSSGFWDSVIVPDIDWVGFGSAGYNSMDGLSGGFLFGAGGSGLITPRFGMSPIQSGTNTPSSRMPGHALTQHSINAAFVQNQIHEAAKVES
ncbi:hypothetical protein H0H87_003785 [Tephrocybe sp. NHM501043]|nr:hypothetical protein H0H87_003785 [Tephrocybe sp. NHM501043]